ncbi:MAG: anaerobic sulfatase maturase [Desulfohalobiaceae bacterium]|nr:anaerobic sulfatase maturase [Desulfohalobiaceae bacterium]
MDDRAGPSFSLLLKPASADCNLSCDYCFYLEKKGLYPESKTRRMSHEVLEQVIRSYLGTSQPVYSMIWQGGEPTLMGEAFFEKVVALQKQFAPRGARISNSLQTNATRISQELAAHLGRYRFLAGCSLDGPPGMHNRYRKTPRGKGTHSRVMRGVRTLRQHRVPVNALVLVSAANVKHPATVYRHLKNKGFSYLQFVPCLEFDSRGRPLPYSIGAKDWALFLNRVFDEWYASDQSRISIRLFESLLARLVFGRAGECVFAERCDRYFVVEHNGDIYPCDFFVDPGYKIGNILDLTWEEALQSPVYRNFAGLKRQWSLDCDSCAYQSLCLGDCLKYRMHPGQDPRRLSRLCPGWKLFYAHSLERLQALAREIAKGRPRAC